MTWPDVVYKIVIDGGGSLLTAIVILAMFSNFFEYLFGAKTVEVEKEVIPSELIETLQVVIDEMREVAGVCGGVSGLRLIEWAKTIDDVINEEG